MSCNKSSKNTSVFQPLKAGQFRDMVAIQTPTLVKDGRGGGVYNWSTIANVWAHIKTVDRSDYINFTNRERFEAGQIRSHKNFIITVRYGQLITTKMRLIYKGRDLEIKSVINVDELNWTVRLLCEELGTGAP
jgi:SPP1 family predicted phage head-tail adaptor